MATFKFTMTFEMTEEEVRQFAKDIPDLEEVGADRIVAFLKKTAAVTKKGYEVDDTLEGVLPEEVLHAVIEDAKSNGEFEDECEQCGGTEDLCCVMEGEDGVPVYTCGKCAADEPERHPEAAVKAALETWETEGHKDSDWAAVLAVAPWADLKSLDFREAQEEGKEEMPFAPAEYVSCRHCAHAPIQEEAEGGCPVYGDKHFA